MTFGDLDREVEYLRFVEEPNPDKKTRRWRVESRSSGDILGRIGWWGAWRQFVFAPHIDTLFNKGCMTDLNAFLDDAMAAWRDDKKVKEFDQAEQPEPKCPSPTCSACHPAYACRQDCHICRPGGNT